MPSSAGRLLPGEVIVLETGRHPVEPVRHALLPAGLVLAGLVMWATTPAGTGMLGAVSAALAVLRWALLLAGGAWIAWHVLDWQGAMVAVTNVRVLAREGPLGRRRSETPLGAIADVRVRTGIVGRRLGYGDVALLPRPGTGGAPVLFVAVREPGELRAAILRARSGALLAGRPASGPVAAPTSVAGPAMAPAVAPASRASRAGGSAEQARRLVAVAALRDGGLLTEAEFQAKKAEILARM